MTGIYVRALVNGKYESVEIDELSDESLDEFIKNLSGQDNSSVYLCNWVKVLVKWIRDNVRPGQSSYNISEN